MYPQQFNDIITSAIHNEPVASAAQEISNMDKPYVELQGLLTTEECAALCVRTDGMLGAPDTVDPDSYGNAIDVFDRIRVWDSHLTELVENRLRARSDFTMPGNVLHPFWFFTRYPLGGQLQPHVDGNIDHGDLTSIATVLIYLNDDFSGGRTIFVDAYEDYTATGIVVPKTGTALVLRQDELHMGEAVSHGCKYLLRSDIMVSKHRPKKCH